MPAAGSATLPLYEQEDLGSGICGTERREDAERGERGKKTVAQRENEETSVEKVDPALSHASSLAVELEQAEKAGVETRRAAGAQGSLHLEKAEAEDVGWQRIWPPHPRRPWRRRIRRWRWTRWRCPPWRWRRRLSLEVDPAGRPHDEEDPAARPWRRRRPTREAAPMAAPSSGAPRGGGGGR
ncbi:hypothetical protein BS78_07G149000 [Paspalum vaginatum]|nr:hypothetical protein BS78_07G149000 [Paspalum vaginatum]